MSDTPSTDEFYWREKGLNPIGRPSQEWAEFARHLERELAEARRQVEEISAPISAAYERFGHLDGVLAMARDPYGADNPGPWHACARDLWRAVKSAQTAKEGGK